LIILDENRAGRLSKAHPMKPIIPRHGAPRIGFAMPAWAAVTIAWGWLPRLVSETRAGSDGELALEDGFHTQAAALPDGSAVDVAVELSVAVEFTAAASRPDFVGANGTASTRFFRLRHP